MVAEAQETRAGRAGATAPQPPNYPDPIIQIKRAHLRTFDAAFGTLSAQGRVAFVAEGAPFQPILDEDALKSLNAVNGSVPLGQAVAKIAEAFDYDAVRAGKGLFLLYKRYSAPEDFPFVPFAEAVRSLRNMVRAIDPLNPHAPRHGSPGFLPVTFVATLDEQQKEALKSGLPVAQLSPKQKQIWWQYGTQLYLQDRMEAMERVESHLQATRSERSAFRWMDLVGSGILVFGYEGPFGLRRAKRQFALSHGFHSQPGSGNMLPMINNTVLVFGNLTDLITDPVLAERAKTQLEQRKVQGKLPDPAAPTPKDYAPRDAAPSSSATTLQAVVERLTHAQNLAGNTAAAERPFRAAVDVDLAEKPVSLVGAERLPPQQVLHALADVYGLRVQRQPDDLLLLTLRNRRLLQDVRHVPETVQQLFPEPWRRALLGRARREEKEFKAQKGKGQPRLFRMLQDPRALQDVGYASMVRGASEIFFSQSAQRALYAAAVHRLRVLVEPEMAVAPEKRLPMGEAGSEAQRLLALLCVTDQLGVFHGFMSAPPPRYLTDFDNAYVQGFFGADHKLDALALCFKDESGTLRPELSVNLRNLLPK